MSTNTYEITNEQWERVSEIHGSKEAIPLLENFDIAGSAVMGDKAFGTIETHHQWTATVSTFGRAQTATPLMRLSVRWI